MIDLSHLFSKLVDQKGNILIPGVNELVKPMTVEEDQLYDQIDFQPEVYARDVGCERLLHHGDNVKKDTLQHRWRYPSLSIHGIEGSFDEAGSKTVIPKKVIGKFSVRLVPYQTPDAIEVLVENFCNKVHKESGSPNKLKVSCQHSGKPWVCDPNHPHFVAGKKALKRVFGIEPDMTREGCSIPIAISMEEATGKNVMLLPIGACDDGAHSQNEKINRSNFVKGIEVFGAYLDEVSKITE